MKQTICDLCKKPITDPRARIGFKAKWMRPWTDYDGWLHENWENIDVHAGCLKRLFEEAKNKKEEKE